MVYSNIPGWLTDNEAKKLYQLSYETSGTILEIGFLFGKSTSVICEALRDRNRKNQFDSYDLNFSNANEFISFYSKIHGDTITVPDLIQEISFSKNKMIIDIASDILKFHNLLQFVNLIGDDFQNIINKKYNLIFCDAMHDQNEIQLNLPKVKELCYNNTVIAIHDVTSKHIKIIEDTNNIFFHSQSDSLGIFYYKI
jgi:predicted O-methyltransferase YrrM